MTKTYPITNADRAKWAASALEEFQSFSGSEREESLGDLIRSLMHWTDVSNFDFDAALCRASDHYRAEVAEAREVLQNAAGDLLAALELCEDVLSDLARLDDGTPSVSALNAARKAIAKAKGGAK